VISAAAHHLNYTEDCVPKSTLPGFMISLWRGKYYDQTWQKECSSYILFPGYDHWSQEARAFVFLFALLYSFLGVAIVADVFMGAIEVITSKTVENVRTNPLTGKQDVVSENVWNATVANLTLMALGSSAPEILLSALGSVTTLGEPADVLGPSTIVGSAAFNLLIITGVCVTAIEAPKVKRVKQFQVFCITAFSSVFAYVWLFIIIEVWSKGIVTVLESAITFAFFPLLVALAYGADRRWRVFPFTLFISNKVVDARGLKWDDAMTADEESGEGGAAEEDAKAKAADDSDEDEAMMTEYLKFRANAVRMISGGVRMELRHTEPGVDMLDGLEDNQPEEFINGMSSDPYCQVIIGKHVLKTKFKRRVLNPIWDTTFFINDLDTSEDNVMHVKVFDHDDLSADDLLGIGSFQLEDIKMDENVDVKVELKDNRGDYAGHVNLTFLVTTAMTKKNADGNRRSFVVNVYSGSNLPASEKANKYIDGAAAFAAAGLAKLGRWGSKQKIVVGAVMRTYKAQFLNALSVHGELDDDGVELPPSGVDLLMHFLTVPWKVLFAMIPSNEYGGGWTCFVVAIIFIGGLTAVVGELASVFGCVVGLEKSVTAITFVALGTSLPDTFASKLAAIHLPTADDAVGNVTGSNSVNVFLGIGFPWLISSAYQLSKGEDFIVVSPGFGLSVMVFCISACICLGTLMLRRFYVGGELGGDKNIANATAGMYICLWFAYIIISSFRTYGTCCMSWNIT